MTRPSKVKLHRGSNTLELQYSDGREFQLRAEYLRVYSPSAEVRGHGAGQEVLQWGKKHVALTNVEAAGKYALKLIFDDGHDSGLYSWDYLLELGQNEATKWQEYIDRLAAAGLDRDPDVSVVKLL
ncbi:MAG TPA: DUF971 domain-containing protein [Pseudomonadales bacterium]|nr:DUF971 domain-containing protein [Pseudomonadales bacterium]